MQKTLGILSILLIGVGIAAHVVMAQAIEEVDLGAQEIQESQAEAEVMPQAEAEAPAEMLAEAFSAQVYTQLPDTPEGIGVDSQGNLYASLFNTGEIVQLKEDGQYVHIAWVPRRSRQREGACPWDCLRQRR